MFHNLNPVPLFTWEKIQDTVYFAHNVRFIQQFEVWIDYFINLVQFSTDCYGFTVRNTWLTKIICNSVVVYTVHQVDVI